MMKSSREAVKSVPVLDVCNCETETRLEVNGYNLQFRITALKFYYRDKFSTFSV